MSSFLLPQPESPFKGIGQGFAQGFQQSQEQDMLNKIFAQTQQGVAPMDAIFQSGIGLEKGSKLSELFNNKRKLELEETRILAASQGTEQKKSDKIGEKFIESHLEDLEEIGGFQLGLIGAKEAIASGNVSGRFSLTGKFLPTSDDQKLKSSVKPFFGIGRKLFGANISKEQSRILEGMLPGPLKSDAENKAGLEVLDQIVTLKQLMADTIEADEAVIDGQVDARDVSRIKRNMNEVKNNFFKQLEIRSAALEEAKKRNLI